MSDKCLESNDSERGWLTIAVLLPAVAYSIAALDIFWTLAAVASVALVFLPRLLHKMSLPWPIVFGLLSTFQPFVLGRIVGVDLQTAMVMEVFLQAWFIYFLSYACIILIRDRLSLKISPRYAVFQTVMASISLNAGLGILSFLVDRILSFGLLPSNTFLMVRLTMAFFCSILLGLGSVWYIKRMEHFSREISNRRPVED